MLYTVGGSQTHSCSGVVGGNGGVERFLNLPRKGNEGGDSVVFGVPIKREGI